MTYLLDSNVWISLVRGSSWSVAAKFQPLASTADLHVCSVVLAELWYGCDKSAKPAANRAALAALVAPFQSLPFDDVAATPWRPTISYPFVDTWKRSDK